MSDYKYKLTIITINYNNLKGLQDTLKSVFEQTWQEFEYIVIDGGSTDGSRELIEKNSDKIDYWVSEKDKGIYNALNKGIVKANGEYILCLNSGDSLYENTTLEKISLELGYGEEIIYGHSYLHNHISSKSNHIQKAPSRLTFQYMWDGALNHQATFIKKKLHDSSGLYNEELFIVSDWQFLMESLIFHKASWRFVDLIVCRYDMSGISEQNIKKRRQERMIIKKNKFNFFLYDEFGVQNDFFYFPFLKNKMNNLKKLIKYLLPYGMVRWFLRTIKNK